MKKITICHLTSLHRALDTRIFSREASSLARAGYEVIVIGKHPKQEIIDGIKIIPSSLKMHNRLSLLIPIFLKSLKQNASIYHFHDPELIVVGCFLKLFGKKVIYDVHEDFEQQLLSARWLPKIMRKVISKIWFAVEKTACSTFDYLLAADDHIANKFSSKKVEVITNYPPISFGSIRSNSNSNGEFIIAYVGGISEDRGILKVLEAINLIDDIPVKFMIAGETKDQTIIEKLSSNPKVVYNGRVVWTNLPSFLSKAHLGVALFQPVPTYLYCSGDGIVKLYEYMCIGLPVLISSLPKLEPLINEIGCGRTVDPTDPLKIADEIRYFYSHPELCKEMGDNGKRAVTTRFNWENEERKLLAVYKKVLGI